MKLRLIKTMFEIDLDTDFQVCTWNTDKRVSHITLD